MAVSCCKKIAMVFVKTPELPPSGGLHGIPPQSEFKELLGNERLYNMDTFSHLCFEWFHHTDECLFYLVSLVWTVYWKLQPGLVALRALVSFVIYLQCVCECAREQDYHLSQVMWLLLRAAGVENKRPSMRAVICVSSWSCWCRHTDSEGASVIVTHYSTTPLANYKPILFKSYSGIEHSKTKKKVLLQNDGAPVHRCRRMFTVIGISRASLSTELPLKQVKASR